MDEPGAGTVNATGGADAPTPIPSPRGGGEKSARTPRAEGAPHTSERAERTAKRLRRAPTLAEQRLWKALRKLEPNGSHFRRQAPFGPYIVDFVCHGARLVLEVDGGIHRHPEVAQNDAEREAWLTQRRYAVVRVSNDEALYEPEAVALRLDARLDAGAPTPTPPREGEGLR